MDVITLSFLVLGAIGAGGVILHYAGFIPKPYRDRLERTETTLAANLLALPPRIGLEVENALLRVSEAAEAKYAQALAAEAKDHGGMAAIAQAARSAEASMVRSVGVDKGMQRKADQLIGSMILNAGQGVLMALRAVAPGVADQIEELLEENPEGAMQLWELVQSRPTFQKYVAPRLKAWMGGQEQASASEDYMGGSVVR